MSIRLALRIASIGTVAVVAIPLAIPPSFSGEAASATVRKAAPPIKADALTITLDKAGIATFRFTVDVNEPDGRVLDLFFRAADFDDAVRSLSVSNKDPKQDSFATGKPHQLQQVLRGNKGAVAPAKSPPSVQLTDLLDSLRGQTVEVSPDGTTAAKKGTLLSIDSLGGQGTQKDATPAPATATTPTTPTAGKAITLWTKDKGVFMIPLSAAATIKFSDARVTNQVQQALDEVARDSGQAPHSVAVKLPKGSSDISYSHSLPVSDIQYSLAVSGAKAALSGRMTLRNTTARAWANVKLRLPGLPWSDPTPVAIDALNPEEVAVFTVSPPAGFDLKPDDALTYKNQQTTPFPDRKFTLATRAKGDILSAIPGPVTIVEGGQVAGQVDTLDFGAEGTASVKLSPYTPITVSQGTPKSTTPVRVAFANGLLTYTSTQTTQLLLANRSGSVRRVKIAPRDGWAPASKSDTATVEQGASERYAFAEKGPAQQVALARWTPDDLAAFRKTVADANGYQILRSTLDQVSEQQDLAQKQLDDLDQQRQALVVAIQAVAARQPTGGPAVFALRVPQLAQDEARVAGLRQRMDLMTAQKAEIQRRFEEFVCGLPPFTVVP